MTTADILVLYDPAETHIGTIHEHLSSFARFSRHRVFYASGPRKAAAADLSLFDAVVVHYSVRVCVEGFLSRANAKALAAYPGPKVLFIQDEYDSTETARRAIESLGIQVVFTCVPSEYLEQVYPTARFPSVRFVQNLTGYVPASLEGMRPQSGPRRWLIGYRGRNLPYWYGDLGQEKVEIGRRMREICVRRGLPVSIEWDEAHRIYGERWYDFIRSCKATLGSESGANVFDEYGKIRRSIQAELERNPRATYDEIRSRFLAQHEGKVRMNQASPRLFEAIVCGSALVLFEGAYSGVVRPHEHFIPLRKDFSNVDEVLDKLHDDRLVTEMTRRAYADVIESGRYSYRAFISLFDEVLAPRLQLRARPARPILQLTLVADAPLGAADWSALRRARQSALRKVAEDGLALLVSGLRSVWRLLPRGWRSGIRAAPAKISSIFKGFA